MIFVAKYIGFPETPKMSYVHDLDTKLDFPSKFDLYHRDALANFMFETVPTMFKVVPFNDYLRKFCSDRSHMLKPEILKMHEENPKPMNSYSEFDYGSPPPKYPCIRGDTKPNLWTKYLNLQDSDSEFGTWMTDEQFHDYFCSENSKK